MEKLGSPIHKYFVAMQFGIYFIEFWEHDVLASFHTHKKKYPYSWYLQYFVEFIPKKNQLPHRKTYRLSL